GKGERRGGVGPGGGGGAGGGGGRAVALPHSPSAGVANGSAATVRGFGGPAVRESRGCGPEEEEEDGAASRGTTGRLNRFIEPYGRLEAGVKCRRSVRPSPIAPLDGPCADRRLR